jgi:hypothetical protein
MTCPHPEKHRHVSQAAAWAALESLDKAGKRDLTIRPYRCGDHWHTGHKGAGSVDRQLKQALRSGIARRPRRKR